MPNDFMRQPAARFASQNDGTPASFVYV
jgi:hypothetical protein